MEDDAFYMRVMIGCVIVAVIAAPVLIPFAAGLWAVSKVVGWGVDRWL